ncbi:TRAP transporter substrate-binding protein [Salinibacterium sp. ZJ70]|uniref:TRAP transporter substrate-binding protein n=1 Tax=Salinibacterium sp. ZJ70 TaxID=2708084 RepID=UPI00141D8C31|nr:TRAP transporter substrate-binding protein [Salinibacterium sp. ZJ70]
MKHSTKRAFALGAAALMATGLVACSSDAPATGGDDSSISPMSLTLGHAYAPDSLQHRAAEQLAELVSEKTDGAVTISVFPSAQLGSWEEMQEGLEIGSVDIVIESLGSLERYTDLAAIEGLPFLYEDADHFFEVWDGDMADDILTAVREDSGFLLIGDLYRGGRQLNSTRLVESPDDLNGLKLRVPNQQTYISTWQALGAAPTPMALNEVFSALEQGAIEGQENPIDVVRFNSFYEVAPFVAETNHLFGNFHFQLWGDTFDSWPAAVQEALRAAADEVSSSYRETSIAEAADHKQYLTGEGVTFSTIDIAEWRAPVSDLVSAANPQVREWAEAIIALR